MDQIGDGCIKLPFIFEIKKRFPDHYFIWATNTGTTVYNSSLKNIANEYIDEIYEKVPLMDFFLKRKNEKYNLKHNFDIIIDTQKAVLRSIALKTLNCKTFISSSAKWFFSDIKPKNYNNFKNNYYLDDLFFMINLISSDKNNETFELKFPQKLITILDNLFNKKKSYIGFAPGSKVKNKMWKLENYIKLALYFENLGFIPTFFLGPEEINFKKYIIEKLPNTLFPEELISEFSGPEITMASSKYLRCSVGNDAGTAQLLSFGNTPLIKLVGPTNSKKFTPHLNNFYIIDSKNYGSKNINIIPVDDVIKLMHKVI